MWRMVSLFAGWSGLLLVAGGCGSGDMVPVEGVVTLDGQPLEGAAVSFVPDQKGRPAQGETDAAGKFTLSTAAAGDGVVPGKYKVGVSKMEKPSGGAAGAAGAAPEGQVQLSGPPMGKGSPPLPKSLVPGKYVNPNTSEITVVVEKGMAPVQIELKSK